MDADQIVGCVEFLQSCWPWATWSEQNIVQWTDVLAPVDLQVARVVSKRARDTQDRPPSIAWFLQNVKAENERMAPTVKALPPGPVDNEGVAEILARTRALLAGQKGREHNHKGPAPCQVCGGLVGTMGDQRGVAS